MATQSSIVEQDRTVCEITVVVVSDFEAYEVKTWQDERRVLKALAQQDIKEPFEALLVENISAQSYVPPDLMDICQNTKIVFCETDKSDQMKDYGVRHSSSDYITVMEADCLPNQCWLRVLIAQLREKPEYSVVSGRTTYGDDTIWKRICSVLDRTFDDLGEDGETIHVSNNGALYRSNIIKKYLYPNVASPFASARLRIRKMKIDGIRFYFEPKALMQHQIGGIGFIKDFRRHTGYSDMVDHGQANLKSIPKLLFRRSRQELADCCRLGSKYLKWYDWPFLACLFLVVPFLQVPGMLDFIRGRGVANSLYR
jgi:hypothetical protein